MLSILYRQLCPIAQSGASGENQITPVPRRPAVVATLIEASSHVYGCFMEFKMKYLVIYSAHSYRGLPCTGTVQDSKDIVMV
jgi:hypothetical protein